MKKIFTLTIALLTILASHISPMAANGDIIGNIYSTDIKAYINGVLVDSYNIGGKTVVILEDITDNFYYNDDQRILVCDHLSKERLIPKKNPDAKIVGEITGNIFETDIRTFIYNKEIPSYSLNGKMAVALEDFGNNDVFSAELDSLKWNPIRRTISLDISYKNNPEYNYKIHLTDKKAKDTECTGNFTVKYTPQSIIHSGDAECFSSSLICNDEGYCMIADFSSNNTDTEKLIQLFRELSSGSQATPIMNEEEKYELINNTITFSINGNISQKMAIKTVSWKGDTTVYIYPRDISPIPQEEIKEIYIGISK